jgi:Ca2+-binding RTX toxin-like protein
VLLGEAGNDTGNGGDGGDFFYLGDGDDIANGDAGNDIFVLTTGNDIAIGGEGQDYFYMGDGNDVLIGNAGVDVMLGEGGNDIFDGGTGVDYEFLGPGGAGDNDTVIVRADSGVAVVYNFEAGGSNDTIRLIGTGISTFSQAIAAITDFTASGNFCVLTVDADTNIWLIGIQPVQLTAADFLFT